MLELRGDWVLAKPIIEEQTKGGILLPDTAKEGSMLARVVAVGPGRKREELYVSDELARDGDRYPVAVDTGTDKAHVDGQATTPERLVKRRFVRVPVEVPVGAVVVIPRWAGYEMKLDGETYLLLREHQCLAVVEGYDER